MKDPKVFFFIIIFFIYSEGFIQCVTASSQRHAEAFSSLKGNLLKGPVDRVICKEKYVTTSGFEFLKRNLNCFIGLSHQYLIPRGFKSNQKCFVIQKEKKKGSKARDARIAEIWSSLIGSVKTPPRWLSFDFPVNTYSRNERERERERAAAV